jgi:hypothetical protein
LSEVHFDRHQVRAAHDHHLLTAYHDHVLALKRQQIDRRVALGRAYLRRHTDRDPGAVLMRETAVVSRDLANLALMRETIAEAKAMIAEGRRVRTKGSLDCLTAGSDYTEEHAAVRLAWSPELLAPVIHYFGMLPILFSIFVARANAKELLNTTSHMFHADPDDITQVKAFAHLTDVDDGCGPFHALPAHLTEKVDRSLDYPRGRVTDEDVERVVGPGRTIPSVGHAGTVTLCDTTRCLHFGGRPPEAGKPIRDLLFIRYLLPTCTVYPQFPGDGAGPNEMRLHSRPDDPVWNAFIGAELV